LPYTPPFRSRRPTTGVDRDDRRADLDRDPGLDEQLADRALPRGRQLDGRLRRLDLADDLVDRDGVARLDPPADELGLGEPLTDVGQGELADRHGLTSPAIGRRRRAPGRGRGGSPPRTSTAGTGCRTR